jgi:hypothetical protein
MCFYVHTQPFTIMKTPPTTYETAKAERTSFIVDWLSEHLMAEKKVACSGWPKTALLLVIQNSAVTNDETEAEKLAIKAYSNEECTQRVKHWQGVIKQLQNARWLPITINQVA